MVIVAKQAAGARLLGRVALAAQGPGHGDEIALEPVGVGIEPVVGRQKTVLIVAALLQGMTGLALLVRDQTEMRLGRSLFG